jgi:hypothetical protein
MRSFNYQQVSLRLSKILNLYFMSSGNLKYKRVLSTVLKKMIFNSTVLWLRIILLSISHSPLLYFYFQDMSRKT